MKGASEILNILDSIGPAMAAIVLFMHRKNATKEMQLVLLFCLIQLFCNTTATIIERAINGNNYWVYKINATACFLVIFYLFQKKLIHLRPVILYPVLAIYTLLSILLIINGDGISQFNSISAALESLLIVGLCLFFFYSKLINTSEEISIPETSIFWCVVGIFTYYAGAFFIFISYKYLIDTDGSTVAVLWRFHNILLFICSLYISYGVLCKNYRTILS
ncbi:hypothetical protein ABDK00_010095 [Niabella insulamsoli]|uniref:hypothetical protein n=1 Tax=Niabella insulamsoli TaxID=3144874 RepID=UPI0031FC0968